MRSIYTLIQVSLLILPFISNSQTLNVHRAENFNLNLPSGQNCMFEARNEIRMTEGFSYKADANTGFTGRINSSLSGVPVNGGNGDLTQNMPSGYEQSGGTVAPPGALPGTIDVSPSGAATYSLPLDLPKGIGGIAPQLAITYSSQGGYGLLGRGWNLAGVSAITRTGNNLYFDNNYSPVSFSNSDNFLLDGERLILTTGSNGTAGSTYTKEGYDFSTITCKASFNGGPDYFEVITNDGTTIIYGQADSKVFIPDTYGNEVYMWLVKKITDRRGNYMTFYYTNPDGQIRLDEIRYTGNTNNTSITPACSVTFQYSTFSDNREYYLNGHLFNSNLKLTSISLSDTRRYEFSYNSNENLWKINLFKGSSLKLCNPTEIIYGNAPNYAMSLSNPNFYTLNRNYLYPGEFDGDGIPDIAMLSPANYIINIKFGNGNSTSVSLPSYQYKKSSLSVTDWDNNGINDIMLQCTDFYSEYVNSTLTKYYQKDFIKAYTFNLGGGYSITDIPIETTEANNTWPPYKDFKYFYGDFNNDGQTERITLKNGNFFNSTGSPAPSGLTNVEQITALDYDGDGGTELFVLYTDDYGAIFKLNGSGLELLYENSFSKKENIFWGDLNGDGLIDYVVAYGATNWSYFINKGDGFIERALPADFNTLPSETGDDDTNTTLEYASAVCLSDINNDKKADILYAKSNTSHNGVNVYVYQPQGTTYVAVCSTAVTSIPANQISNMQLLTADLNNDGQVEIIFGNDDDGRLDGGTKLHETFDKITFGSKLDDNMFVKSITDGNSNMHEISYSYAQTSSSASVSFPVMKFSGPICCASRIRMLNGTTVYSDESYTYTGGRIHLKGKGFLGFESVSRNNSTTGLITVNSYKLNPTFFMSNPLSTDVYKGTTWLSNTKYTYATSEGKPQTSDKIFFQYLSLTENTDKLTGLTIKKATTIDASTGFLTSSVETYGVDGTVTTSYSNPNAFGSPGIITTIRQQNGESFTTYKAFTYDDKGNVLTSEDNNGVTTTYTYCGDKTNVYSVESSESSTLKKVYTYDNTWRYIKEVKTYLGGSVLYTEKTEYDSEDRPIKFIDKNGLMSYCVYDQYNNKIVDLAPNGRRKGYRSGWCTISDKPEIKSYSQVTAENQSYAITYFDCLGRKIRTISHPSGGSETTVTTSYNSQGQVTSEVSSTGITTSYNYFTDGRLQSKTSNGHTVNYSYSGATVNTTINGIVSSKTVNSFGQVISAEDAGGKVSYSYHCSGQPLSVTSNGKTVSMLYDTKGRQTRLTDPDAGVTNYSYDNLGRLYTQSDANGNSTTMTYDPTFGYVTSKAQSNSSENRTVSYQYYTTAPNFGLLKSEYDNYSRITTSYTYDKFGNLSTKTDNIESKDYTFRYEYDLDGKLVKTIYPDNVSISNTYNGEYLSGVFDDNAVGANKNIITSIAYNNRDQVTSCNVGYGSNTTALSNQYDSYGYLKTFTIGPSGGRIEYGYDFDETTLNLMSRYKTHLGTSETVNETFTYDNVDRLEGWTVNYQGSPTPYTMNYSSNGNVTQKSDMGYYSYNQVKPHAVAYVSQLSGSAVSSLDNNIRYNVFGKVKSMTLGSSFPYNHWYAIKYGPDGQRRVTNLDSAIITKYVGLYEERSNGDVLHYINGVGGVSAVLVTNGTNRNMYYLYSDYQGSLTAVANETGAIVKEFSYDPWGRRRNANNWNDYDSETADNLGAGGSQLFTRGYTGHEHIAYFKLINMNGRMYDPRLGRFLSPDPFVQSATNSQSYNRYTYCLNNPLKYTDPSGYFANPLEALKKLLGFDNDRPDKQPIDNLAQNFGFDDAKDMAIKMGIISLINIGATVAGMYVGGALFPSLNGFWGGFGYGMTSGFTRGFLNGSMGTWILGDGDFKQGMENGALYGWREGSKDAVQFGLGASGGNLNFWQVLLVDNISDNQDITNIRQIRLHATIFGYDFSRNDKNWGGFYTIFSKGLSGSQRLDMAFESVHALSLVKDIKHSYRGSYRQAKFKCLGRSNRLFKARSIFIPTSIISPPANVIKEILNPFWFNNHFIDEEEKDGWS